MTDRRADRAARALRRRADRDGARRRRKGLAPSRRGALRSAALQTRSCKRSPIRPSSTLNGLRIATTADGYVVKPLRFPGGSIGELAVNGTVNDLAVSGARPLGADGRRSSSRPGFPGDDAARRSRGDGRRGARGRASTIVGGDTKVVEHGLRRRHVRHDVRRRGGRLARRVSVRDRIRAGRPACCSPVRSAITASRFCWRAASSISKRICARIRARCAPFVDALLDVVRAMGCAGCAIPRAAALRPRSTSWCARRELGITLFEESIPLRDEVRGACEILGLDPLHIANEGQLLGIVAPEVADAALAAVRAVPGGDGCSLHRRSAREAGARRARRHRLRRQPHHRHAGRRSVAAHMLDAKTSR